MIAKSLKNNQVKNLTTKIANSLLSATKRPGQDLVFIRHA